MIESFRRVVSVFHQPLDRQIFVSRVLWETLCSVRCFPEIANAIDKPFADP